jgi:putative GTP pyrophosphokinase
MLTASKVNKAGRDLRRYLQDPSRGPFGPRQLEALNLLVEFRAAHSRPLIKANNGLRSMVRSEGCTVQVSQRLKRMSTILDKLVREPTMAPSKMQDIGGCRAILGSLDEVRRVERRIARNRPPVKIDDYITSPQASGYRAVHLIVTYDDRPIEIQLRTQRMHQWAVAVERLSGHLDENLKSGQGPQEVLDWLTAIAEALAIEDEGGTVDSTLMERIQGLARQVRPIVKDFLTDEH